MISYTSKNCKGEMHQCADKQMTKTCKKNFFLTSNPKDKFYLQVREAVAFQGEEVSNLQENFGLRIEALSKQTGFLKKLFLRESKKLLNLVVALER